MKNFKSESQRVNVLLAVTLIFLVLSCNEWDDHNRTLDKAVDTDLFTAIENKQELSTFAAYLVATGYNEVLKSSIKFTVWAPDNTALQNLDASITDDPEKLRRFVANHISYSEYSTSTSNRPVRIKMLSDKVLDWSNSKLEDAEVSTANQLAKNGLLHIVNKTVIPIPNIWEVLMNNYSDKEEVKYMISQNYSHFDSTKAVQIGINSETGEPIYLEGTGYTARNYYLDQFANVANEDSLFTFIVFSDETFNKEVDSLKYFFKTFTNDVDSASRTASRWLLKDMAIRGRYLPDQLPEYLLSRYKVKIPMTNASIVDKQIASNGVIYVVNPEGYLNKREQIPAIRIQGFYYTGARWSDYPSTHYENIHQRVRTWADQSIDLRAYDEGGHTGRQGNFYVYYRLPYLFSTSYKVYWRTINDFVDTTAVSTAFQQRLVIGLNGDLIINNSNGNLSGTILKDFGFKKVTPINRPSALGNPPVYLGDYTHGLYTIRGGNTRRPYFYLISANSTDRNLNAIELDYIELVPIFN